MIDARRFGNKLRLPSTAEIKHELRLMEIADRIAQARAALKADAVTTSPEPSPPPIA